MTAEFSHQPSAAEAVAHGSETCEAPPSKTATAHRRIVHRLPLYIAIGLLAFTAFAVPLVWRGPNRDGAIEHPAPSSIETAIPDAAKTSERVRVEVVHPAAGGMARTTTQPGAVHAFEYAELFAKVSGYLGEQSVDIGDHVTHGQLLARIDVPELDEGVKEAAASLERAKSAVAQGAARVKTAEAEAEAAAANIKKMQADVISAEGRVTYRASDFERMERLVQLDAIDKKLRDEKLDALTASRAAKLAADAAVENAQAQRNAAQARVLQANADLDHARSEVDVAQAALDKSRVLLGYTRIVSPYDGVITARHFHPGAFIRAANDGGTVPLLNVERTDKMRIVVQVPDRDVPYTNVGDKATIEIDALPGKQFHGTVSRTADHEDPRQKTMRAEIDLPNPDGLLREGMYGRHTTIELEPPSDALTIPSSALVGKTTGHSGEVYVVRDGQAHLTPITIGQDDGRRMEVLTGLTPADVVVAQYNGAIAEGTPVEVVSSEARGHGAATISDAAPQSPAQVEAQ